MDRTKTRDRLVEVAADRFHAQGYAGTGVAEILRTAGVGSGSLYHYFQSKDALLAAVLDRFSRRLEANVMQPVFDRIDDPIERIFGILDSHRKTLERMGCQGGCPVANLACELSDTHPEVAAKVLELFGNWRGWIERCLEDAAERLPRSLDRRAVASFVLAVMEGAIMQCRVARSIEPFDRSLRQLRDYFDRLMRNDGGRKSAK